MKLINKTTIKASGNRNAQYGIYECPVCKSNFEASIPRVNQGAVKNCGCSRHLRTLPIKISGLKVVKDLGNIADNKGRKRRKAELECPYCSSAFSVIVTDAKRNRSVMNCGCQKGKGKPACNNISIPKKDRELSQVDIVAARLSISKEEATLLHYTYGGMKARCLRETHYKYHRYGGRGITICNEWLDSFIVFAIDMGAKPSKDLSIDRIDNSGNYEPNNCRWATQKEQQNNKG